MTPREKAIELMDKYWELDVDDKASVWTEKCKQCCLITVDEIRDNMPLISDIQDYWQKVKQEIENL